MSHFLFTKAERISSNEEILSLIQKSKSITGSLSRIYFRQNSFPHSRVAISVPKKLFKSAVKRNLIKRRIREAYRLNKYKIAELNKDILIVYNSREIKTYRAIDEEINNMFKRIISGHR